MRLILIHYLIEIGCDSIISYAPFWATLERKNISQYDLINNYGLSTGTLDSLRKNKGITLHTLEYLCNMINCDINDVVEFIQDK